jgi:hypothetical protein
VNRLQALMLLEECTGDHIWSLAYCRQRSVPEQWIMSLSECFESGFDDDLQTIYWNERLTNQYEGLRDVDLAVQLGRFLQLPVDRLLAQATSRRWLVKALQQSVEED